MTGVLYASLAGVGFGVFQAVNRRANQQLDVYRAVFIVQATAATALLLWVVAAEDLTLLASAPPVSFLFYAGAGLVHFFAGWTCLSLSQQKAGAAVTGAVAGSAPLLGAVLAALVLGEPLTLTMLAGLLLVVGGLAALSLRGGGGLSLRSVPWFALATALTWAASPLFIRWGLEGLDSPLLGVTIGIISSTVAYGAMLGATRSRRTGGPISKAAWRWVLTGGALVSFCIAVQWKAFDIVAVAVGVTLNQLAVPTVIIAAPLLVGGARERPSPPLLGGAAAVLAGSLLVVLSGT